MWTVEIGNNLAFALVWIGSALAFALAYSRRR